MARIHNSQLCPYCGAVVAYAEYKNVKEGFYGDAFSGMKYTNHKCEQSIKNGEVVQKLFKEAMSKLEPPQK